ncbi:ABC transporter permease subunit [Actinoplanes sp. NPDC049316]|uniref:ABC transporter permease subunit n=1 Tax=Actinoplanes sp. NPDC049316 TaxID=3154727 RepID=UPI00341C7528
MSLYTAETRRLTKRRFTRFFLIGVVLVLGAIAAGMFLTNHKNTPEVVAAAQAKADREFQQAVVRAEADRKACEAQTQPGSDCSQMWTPTREEFQAQWYMPPTFDFRKNFKDMVTTLASILAVAAFVIGASFVGAEWSSGGMMNLLLWRPQRLKVLNTKLAALLVLLAGVTVALSALWTGAFALIASLRGTLDGMTSGAWQSYLLMELRGLVMVLVAGAVGFGLASIGRHTAVAMGVAIGVLVVLQAGLGTVLAMAQVKYLEMYLAPTWIAAWMTKSVELIDYNAPCVGSGDTCVQPSLTLTWQMAGAGIVILIALVLGTAMWTLRKRDIT